MKHHHLRLLLLLFTIHLSLFTFSQTWEPVGGGLDCAGKIFVQGQSCPIQDTLHLGVYALCVSNEKLYAGGLFNKTGKLNVNNITCWNGTKWDTLGKGTNGKVQSLCVYNKMLIVGGVFEQAGGKKAGGIAEWIDTPRIAPKWHYSPHGVYKQYFLSDAPSDHDINAICEYKGTLYIAGVYGFSNDPNVARGAFSYWNTNMSAWVDIPAGKIHNLICPEYFCDMAFLTTYKDNLYVIGEQYNLNKYLMISWNGKKVSALPNAPSLRYDINCAVASDSGLYFAGGNYIHRVFLNGDDYGFGDTASKYIFRLNDDGSYKIIKGLPKKSFITSMVFYNGKLYVAGYFDEIEGKKMNNVACWDGQNWQSLGDGLINSKGHPVVIRCLCVYKGDLYAGGDFDHSGNTMVLNIAKFTLNRSGK